MEPSSLVPTVPSHKVVPFLHKLSLGLAGLEVFLLLFEIIQQWTHLAEEWVPDGVSTVASALFWIGLTVLAALAVRKLWEKGWYVAALPAAVYVGVVLGAGTVYYGWFLHPVPGLIAVYPPVIFGRGHSGVEQQLGMLLTNNLHDDGTFSTVPPEELEVGYSERRRETALNSHSARNHARRKHARYYLLGNATSAGNRLLVSIRLIDCRSKREVATASDSAAANAPDVLARGLSARLTLDYLRRRRRPAMFTELGAPPVEDFNAYIRAEEAIRHGDFMKARDDLGRHEHSQYAPATYLHAVAEVWGPRDEGYSATLSQVAYGLGRGRSPADTLLLRGLATAYWGVPWEPESAFGEANQRFGSVEGLYQAAEVVLYSFPARGEPVDDAEGYFERVLRASPGHYRATFQLLRLALRQGDTTRAIWFAAKARRAHPDYIQTVSVATIQDLLHRDTSQVRVALRLIQKNWPEALPFLLRLVSDGWRGAPGDPVWRWGFQAVTDLMIQEGRDQRLEGLEARATWEYAQGRWRTARRFVEMMPAEQPTRFSVAGTFIGAFGDRLPAGEVEGVRRSLLRWTPPRRLNPNPVAAARVAAREYYLGVTSAGVGDRAGAALYVGRLRALARDVEDSKWPESSKLLLPELEAGVSGVLELSSRNPRGALESLGAVTRQPPRFLVGHPLYAHQLERYARAEADYQAGNLEESLRWFRSLTDDMALNPFIAIAHHRQAQIYDQLGNHALAQRHAVLFAGMAGHQQRPFRWEPVREAD